MKDALRRILASPLAIIAAITALGSTAVRPILAPALPCSDDIAFHLLRLTQLDHLLRQGVLYSRWAPDMAQGYGYPFFNFYAPLSYYAALVVSGLGFGLNLGLRISFALAIIASGLAAYRLARDHFSRAAALVAAVAYMYAPYQGYDIFFRGNWAESAAWPLLPLSLWTIGRLARGGGWGWLAAAGVSYAAVLLTHNVFALIFSPLLAAYALLMAWTAVPRQPLPWRRFAEVGGAILLGLGLSAFFWLPAMVERSLVYSDRLLAPPGFVYWNNFISLAELLAAPRAIHPDLLNPSPPRALGLLPVLLGLPALAALFSRRQGLAQRRQIAFFGGALLLYAFLMTAVSQPIWDALPLIEYVQFPWRLLGPAALCLAILTAATIDLLPGGKIKPLAAGGAMALLILSGLFWFAPRYCPGLERPTVADIQEYERVTDTIGTTAKGEYVPRTSPFFPPQPAGETFAADALPADAVILWQETKGLRSAAEIETAAPITVTLNIFAYPGWRVTVDGRPAPISPSPDYGLIAFAVPEGRHQIAVHFGETPLRLAADFASLISLLAAVGLTAVSWRRRSQSAPLEAAEKRPPAFSHSLAPILWGLALCLFVSGLPRWETPLYRSGLHDGALRPGVPWAAGVTANPLDFASGLRLLGFTPWPAQSAASDPIRLDLYWTFNERPSRAYGATVLLIGPDGGLWSPGNSTPPRDFRPFPQTMFWQPGQYFLDSHLVEPLPGAPPGVYELRLRLFDGETLQAIPTLPQQALETSLGTITLTRPSRPAEVDPQYAADAVWPPLALLGYNLDRAEATPGDPFALTLFWRVRETAADDLFARLTLLGPDGQPALQLDLPPIRADFPGSQWRPGEIWRGQHTFRLPAGLEDGRHRWRLQLCAASGLQGDCLPLGDTADLADLADLRINAPTRLWTPPPLTTTLDAPLEEIATLLGANWQLEAFRPGEPFPVSLIWRAEAETAVSYAVFLHLLDSDGRLIAQHDGEPAGWTRPTTGWLPGEIVVDERVLALPPDLPPGRYTLLAGLYDRADGRRLALPDGGTAVTLEIIEYR